MLKCGTFLFYYTDQVYFKSFEDAKSHKINGREPYYWETYRGYLAVQITNRNIVEKIQEACYNAPYSFRVHRFESFPW